MSRVRPGLGTLAVLAALAIGAAAPGPAHAQARRARPRLLSVRTAPGDSALAWAPRCTGRLLVKAYFAVCYADRLREPFWVGYGLEVAAVTNVGRVGSFKVDSTLPESVWSRPSDYARMGFDIGHMAPAGDFSFADSAERSTFVMSNGVPQFPAVNRGRWRSLETEVRNLAIRHGDVWIFSGPLFLDSTGAPTQPRAWIGSDSVAVPTHFFKVILCLHPDREPEMAAFIIPNSPDRLPGPTSLYLVTVDSLQTLTGWDFFAALPDSIQKPLEAHPPRAWPLP